MTDVRRRLGGAVLCAATTMLAAGCGGPSSEAKTVTVAAEPSLSSALPEAASIFRQTRTVTEVNVRYDSSDRLVEQLSGDARADVLITADEATMNTARTRRLVTGEVWTIGTDRLVLVVAEGNPAGVSGLGSVAGRALAVCADATPCGAAAGKLAGAAGVSLGSAERAATSAEVRDRVARGQAEAGIAYASDAAAARDQVDAVEIAGAAAAANRLQAAVLAEASTPGPAADFVKFLATPQAQNVLRGRGFGAP